MTFKQDIQKIHAKLQLNEFLKTADVQTRIGKMVRTFVVANREELSDPQWLQVLRWLSKGGELINDTFYDENGKFRKLNWFRVLFGSFGKFQDWIKEGGEIYKKIFKRDEQSN